VVQRRGEEEKGHRETKLQSVGAGNLEKGLYKNTGGRWGGNVETERGRDKEKKNGVPVREKQTEKKEGSSTRLRISPTTSRKKPEG